MHAGAASYCHTEQSIEIAPCMAHMAWALFTTTVTRFSSSHFEVVAHNYDIVWFYRQSVS